MREIDVYRESVPSAVRDEILELRAAKEELVHQLSARRGQLVLEAATAGAFCVGSVAAAALVGCEELGLFAVAAASLVGGIWGALKITARSHLPWTG